MASATAIKSNLLRYLILVLSCSMVLPFPIGTSMKTSDLPQFLKNSMARMENSLAQSKRYPILRRRIKSPLQRYRDGSHDNIGKGEEASSQLEINEAYRNFLRNNLHMTTERRVPPSFLIKSPASTEHKRKLFCRSGYLVEILPNGTVRGTQDHTSPYTKLTILMYARQLVIIRNQDPPYRYLVMTEDSKVKAVSQPTIQSVFFYRVRSKHDRHNYLTFQKVYRRKKNWFLALRKKDRGQYGAIKKGRNTNPNKRSAQFIVVGD